MMKKIINSNQYFLFLNIINLIVCFDLVYNVAIISDESGTSPAEILGGDFWLNLDIITLLMIFISIVVGVIDMAIKSNKILQVAKIILLLFPLIMILKHLTLLVIPNYQTDQVIINTVYGSLTFLIINLVLVVTIIYSIFNSLKKVK